MVAYDIGDFLPLFVEDKDVTQDFEEVCMKVVHSVVAIDFVGYVYFVSDSALHVGKLKLSGYSDEAVIDWVYCVFFPLVIVTKTNSMVLDSEGANPTY